MLRFGFVCCLGWVYLSSAPQYCELAIQLVDSETGHQVPGVIRLFAGDSSQALELDELLSRARGLNAPDQLQDWYVLPGAARVTVPRTEIRLEAISGIESKIQRMTLDLSGCDQKEVRLSLEFFSHLSKDGWYAGNTHLHLRDLTPPQVERYLEEIPAADRLDVLFLSYLERVEADRSYITNRYPPFGREVENRFGTVIDSTGEEYRHNFGPGGEGYGHVIFLNLRQLLKPASIGPGISGRGNDSEPMQFGIDRARRQNATTVWCHNSWGLEDVPNFLTGRLDALNIFDGGSHGSYEDSFYHYLNTGLRVPFSTGTDWFLYDFARVYARVDGVLDSRSWLSSLRAGRTFITNSPILRFKVGDSEPGDVENLTEPTLLPVQGSARARSDFGSLELIVNGEVKRISATHEVDGLFLAALTGNVRLDSPAWLALRVSGSNANEYGRPLFAHSSAIYFDFNGKRVRADKDKRFLRKEIQQAVETIEKSAVFASSVERERVLRVYREGAARIGN